MKCKHYDNAIAQAHCDEFKPNQFWRCSYKEDCIKDKKIGKTIGLDNEKSELEEILEDYGIGTSGWFDDGYST